MVLVAPVLGQMEADPPHLVPQRRPPLQESREAVAALNHFAADPSVQVVPNGDQRRFAQVLGAGIGGALRTKAAKPSASGGGTMVSSAPALSGV